MKKNEANKNNLRIVILGGGTAGWMTAAALAKKYSALPVSIVLIESEELGTVGVGESTIPHIRHFNQFLGINETDFIRATNATFKLGIQFRNWGELGGEYIHPFGAVGSDINGVEFQHFWAKAYRAGNKAPFDDYSVAAVAMKNNRFCYPASDGTDWQGRYNYAFHFDAVLYASYLRKYAENLSVVRIEGKVSRAECAPESGDLCALYLESGGVVDGDFFVDCTGFRALLINGVLGAEYESWAHWLPCDRALAMPSGKVGELTPYTRATAHSAGWCWRIPLQHRIGNGCVYSSDFMQDEVAWEYLISQLDGPCLLEEPRRFSFVAGMRPEQWKRNCVAIGLSGGFLEPLESTSIYLIQVGIKALLDLFSPHAPSAVLAREFNTRVGTEYLRIRDFIIMHYAETSRDDSEFWRYCKNMKLPDSLARRQKIFRHLGHVDHQQYGVYAAVCIGQGVIPEQCDPRVASYPDDEVIAYLDDMRGEIVAFVDGMPSAESFIRELLARGAN